MASIKVLSYTETFASEHGERLKKSEQAREKPFRNVREETAGAAGAEQPLVKGHGHLMAGCNRSRGVIREQLTDRHRPSP